MSRHLCETWNSYLSERHAHGEAGQPHHDSEELVITCRSRRDFKYSARTYDTAASCGSVQVTRCIAREAA